MEEKDRRTGRVNVGFALSVGTRPNVVKFEVEGAAVLEGKDEEVRKMLEADPETQVPLVFHRVYQHIFMTLYLLATLVDAPAPPANLLQSSQQQMPIVQMSESVSSPGAETAQQVSQAPAPEEGTVQPQSANPPASEGATTPTQEETVTVPPPPQASGGVQPRENETSPKREFTLQGREVSGKLAMSWRRTVCRSTPKYVAGLELAFESCC